MTAVISWFYKTVETTVILLGEVVLHVLGPLHQPLRPLIAHILNLRVGELHLLRVFLFQIVAVAVTFYLSAAIPLIAHHLRTGVL